MLLGVAERLVSLSRYSDAEKHVREALIGVHRCDDRMGRVLGLALLCRTAAETGRPEWAGVLWGAVERDEAAGEIG